MNKSLTQLCDLLGIDSFSFEKSFYEIFDGKNHWLDRPPLKGENHPNFGGKYGFINSLAISWVTPIEL